MALAADELERLPADLLALAAPGGDPGLVHARLHRAGSQLALVLVEVLVLFALGRLRPGLLARPLRFIAVVLCIGSLALAAGAAIEIAGGTPTWPRTAAGALPWTGLLRAWATLLMWGVLFGGLCFRHLQQRADDRRITLLLARRARVARQVLEASLGRARAQIDPAMIAGVLRTVRRRIEPPAEAPGPGSGGALPDPADAVALLDHLAAWLRLMLQRVRHEAPTLAGDLALVRAYAALQQARDGARIELAFDPALDRPALAGRPVRAVFLAARALLDAALEAAPGDAQDDAPPRRVRQAFAPAEGGREDALRIETRFDAAAATPAHRLALENALRALHPALELREDPSSHGGCLVAHVPLA